MNHSKQSPSPESRRPPAGSRQQRLLDEGRALHAQGRIHEAFSRYQAAVAQAPEDADALHLLGLAYLGLGQAALGLAFVRRALARSPGNVDFIVNLAMAEARQGRPGEALLQMERACQLRPDEARLHAGLADLHLQLDQFAEAERAYLKAIELAPGKDAAAWHEALARLCYRRWALPEALASGDRAASLAPAIAQRLNLGFAQPQAQVQRDGSVRDARASAPLLEPLRPMSAAELASACAERDLIVIDDFLPDAMALREQALRLLSATEGAAVQQGNFPGLQTPPQPCQAAMQRIAGALARAVKWDSPDNGALRLSLARDAARADVHVDNPTLTDIFGGVLYLSLPEHCQGGTRFYRHRATGWDRRPEAAALKARGFSSFLDFQKRSLPANRQLPFSEWLQRRDASWEALFEVPMRFNRLILFRSDFFHSITELFGDRASNGRLVQLFHFEGAPRVN